MEINWVWLTRWEGFYLYLIIVFLVLFFGGVKISAKRASKSATQSE
jgi:hypothetical protein